MENQQKSSRKNQILQALALMLESNPGKRITTAKLAEQVGVSEAALYRHFPSKAKMFEGLILFVEETIFSRINQISNNGSDAEIQLQQILTLLLNFFEKNPGITRIFTGDAITGENDRLRVRIAQFYERVEAQLRNILRNHEINSGCRPAAPTGIAANLLLATIEGRVTQFVRSDFKRRPTENWNEQWPLLMAGFFREPII